MDSAKKSSDFRVMPPVISERQGAGQPSPDVLDIAAKTEARTEPVHEASQPAAIEDIFISPLSPLSLLRLLDGPKAHTQVANSNLGYDLKERSRGTPIDEAISRTRYAIHKMFREPITNRIAGRIIEAAAPHSNFEFTDEQKLQYRDVKRANRAAEALACRSLTASQEESYDHVSAALWNEPDAALALQLMLFTGAFTHGSSAPDKPDLLKRLEAVLTDPMDVSDKQRLQLLTELVREIADPSCIYQGNFGTCSAASASMMLAAIDPSEYVRLVCELASARAETQLKSGERVPRFSEPLSAQGTRSYSQFLLIPALMDHASRGRKYHDTKEGGGLEPNESGALLHDLFGKPIETIHFDERNPVNVAALRAFLSEKNLYRGDLLQVHLRWTKGHALAVEGLVTDHGQEYVQLLNPHGTEDRFTIEDFAKRLSDLNTDDPVAAQRLGVGGRVIAETKQSSTLSGNAIKPTS